MQKVRVQAEPVVQIDNDRVIVTQWRFAPGAETGQHRHAFDYVVVPMTTGNLLIETPGQSHLSALQTGQTYSRAAGVEHNVVNANPFEFIFIEIELKQKPDTAGAHK